MKTDKTIKNNSISGITLISLVVTIIVLLILAGISISMITGDNGIIDNANTASLESKRISIKKLIEMTLAQEQVINSRKEDIEILEATKAKLEENEYEELKKYGNEISILDIQTSEECSYFYVIVDKDIYIVSVEGTKYESTQSDEDITLAEGDIKYIYTPSEYTNGNVKVKIESNTDKITDYVIKYKIGDTSDWLKYSNEIEVDKNCNIHARLEGLNGKSTVATGTVAIIDRLDPKEFIPTTTATTNSITVSAKAADQEASEEYCMSGIKGYYFSSDNGKNWTDFQTSGTYTFEKLTQGVTYSIQVKAEDYAGNTKIGKTTQATGNVPGLQTGDVTFSYEPSTSTNGDVKVGITGNNTGYKLQYKTEKTGESGEVLSWTDYTGEITLTRNQSIYARVVDGTGQAAGTYATGTVANIDKELPSATIKLSSNNTYTDQAITATITHSDTGTSGVNIKKCKWIYNASSTAIGTSESSYTGGTFTNNGKQISLQKTTPGTYYLHVLTTDNAGNVKETISGAITVTQVYSLASKVQIGDYVSYNATDNYSYKSPIGSGTSHGNGHSQQEFKSSSNMKWQVLSKNTSTGEVVLISEIPTESYLKFKGVTMYLYAEQEINNICSIYGHGKGANTSKTFTYNVGDVEEGLETKTLTNSGARSLNLDDITGKLSVNLESTDENYGKAPYKRNIYYPTLTKESGFSMNYIAVTHTRHNFYLSDYKTSATTAYYNLFDCQNSTYAYFISSRCVAVTSGFNRYYVDKVRTDIHAVEANYLCDCNVGNTYTEYGSDVGLPLRPVVYLKTTVVTSGKDSSGSWILLNR